MDKLQTQVTPLCVKLYGCLGDRTHGDAPTEVSTAEYVTGRLSVFEAKLHATHGDVIFECYARYEPDGITELFGEGVDVRLVLRVAMRIWVLSDCCNPCI